MSNFIQEINAQQKGKLMFLGVAVKWGWRGQLWSCWEVPPAPTSNQQYPPAPTSTHQHPPQPHPSLTFGHQTKLIWV